MLQKRFLIRIIVRVRIWYRSDIMRDIVKKKCIEGRKICDTISICTCKLEAGKLQPGVHVITLAVSERNQLEIYPTIQFKQPAFPEQELFVVGITKGYDEAVELVEQIVQEVYDQTGTCDIRSYILEKEQGR